MNSKWGISVTLVALLILGATILLPCKLREKGPATDPGDPTLVYLIDQWEYYRFQQLAAPTEAGYESYGETRALYSELIVHRISQKSLDEQPDALVLRIYHALSLEFRLKLLKRV